jgi:mevalonate kinase
MALNLRAICELELRLPPASQTKPEAVWNIALINVSEDLAFSASEIALFLDGKEYAEDSEAVKDMNSQHKKLMFHLIRHVCSHLLRLFYRGDQAFLQLIHSTLLGKHLHLKISLRSHVPFGKGLGSSASLSVSLAAVFFVR